MSPETNPPSNAVPSAKRVWWAVLVVLPLLFVGLTLLGWAGPASVVALLFVAVMLLPLGAKFLTVGDRYVVLNAVRDGFAQQSDRGQREDEIANRTATNDEDSGRRFHQ
jgi:hypothetical protein